MKTITYAGAVALALIAASCSSNQGSESTTQSMAAVPTHLAPAVIDSLLGDWSVTQVGDVAIDMEKLPTVSLTLNDGQTIPDSIENIVLYYAFTGCNTINGAFEVKPAHRMAPTGEFLSTMMLCPGVDYDQQVSKAVEQVQAYDIEHRNGEATLKLYDKNGQRLLTLRKHDLEFLNGAWTVTSVKGTPVTSDVGIVIDLPEGKIHANGPCNVINGKVKAVMEENAGIKISDLRATRMSCPELALEQQMIQCLDNTAKAIRGGKPDTALLLDSHGDVLLTLVRTSMDKLAE